MLTINTIEALARWIQMANLNNETAFGIEITVDCMSQEIMYNVTDEGCLMHSYRSIEEALTLLDELTEA